MTRAVLLNPTGAVHRVVIGSDGADITACGQKAGLGAPVTPVQALVWPVAPCGACWAERERRWQHFLEGVRAA